jgi:cytochrome b561
MASGYSHVEFNDMIQYLRNDRYNALSIGVHWLTLALLVAVYALIELRGIYPKGSAAHELMKTWHFMLGLTVFGIVFVRLALRALFPTPAIQPPPPAWQHALAKSMHLLLYAFLLVMPILGWLTLSAKGKVIPFFGLELPPLIGADKALARSLEDIHETIGTLGYYLIGLHAAAALFHHYITHDNTLWRMLPRRRIGSAMPPAGRT